MTGDKSNLTIYTYESLQEDIRAEKVRTGKSVNQIATEWLILGKKTSKARDKAGK